MAEIRNDNGISTLYVDGQPFRQLGNGQRFRTTGKVKKCVAGTNRAENQKRDYI